MGRWAGLLVMAAGLTLGVLAFDRLVDSAAAVAARGAEAAGLIGRMSGPDSIPRSMVRQDVIGCLSRYRAALGGGSVSQAEAILSDCVALPEAHLAAAPADAFAWVVLAALRLERDGPGAGALEAWRRARLAGPNDGSSVDQRIAVGLALAPLMDERDRDGLRTDLARAVYYGASLPLTEAVTRPAGGRRDALLAIRSGFDDWYRARLDAALERARSRGPAAPGVTG